MALLPQLAWAEDRLPKLPTLTGKITFTEGSFNGFAPPRVGDALKLDLQRLDAVRDTLPFHGPEPSHVVLAAPLRVEKIERSGDGVWQSARLVSWPDKGGLAGHDRHPALRGLFASAGQGVDHRRVHRDPERGPSGMRTLGVKPESAA